MEHLLVPYESVKCLGNGVVLVLAPHPDDEVFGCGGAIMSQVDAGDPVHVIILTDGGRQEGMGDDPQLYMEQRKRESIDAASILGYGSPLFWGLPDRGLKYGEQLIQRVISAIREFDAQLIYAPSLLEMHPDHRVLGMVAAEALRRHGNDIRLAMYEVGIPLCPNRLLDITPFMARKQTAMKCFASQFEIQDYDQHISALNRFRTYTLSKEIKAAEAYFLVTAKEIRNDPLGLYASEHERQKRLGLDLYYMDEPLVSVIIRSIGRKDLHRALDSVALQTYPNIEVVVVNAKGEKDPRFGEWCGRFPLRQCHSLEPLLRSKAANVGLENARGEYLIFLDDDDWFYPDHVSGLAKALMDAEKAYVAYAGVECIRLDSNGNSERLQVFNEPFDRFRLLSENFIPMHAALFRKEVLQSGCRFDENIMLHEDWDFWIQLSQLADFVHLDKVSAAYRISASDRSGIWYDDERTHQAVLKVLEKWWPHWDAEKLQHNLWDIRNKLIKMRENKDKLHKDAMAEREALKSALDESQNYANSLRDEVAKVHDALDVSQNYANSLAEDILNRLQEISAQILIIRKRKDRSVCFFIKNVQNKLRRILLRNGNGN
jgi:LmbE family N-acetylglucosaminyl deacetylase/glycosyltransferase involved in cell wall biosynthesis